MKSNICPSCGEAVGSSKHMKRMINVDYLQSFAIEYDFIECKVCGYSGSPNEQDDAQVEIVKKESDIETLKKLIEEVTATSEKASNIERAFSLPPRTLNRWKAQGGSAAALALMKLIKTSSWLIQVAEHGYDPEFAKNETYKQAAFQLSSDRESMGFQGAYSMHTLISNGEEMSAVTLRADPVSPMNEANTNQIFISISGDGLKAIA